MSAPTVAVTVRLADFGGPAVANVKITARLSDLERTADGTFVSTEVVTGLTDASGVAVLNVFPNAISTGLGTRGTTVRFIASIPGSRGLDVKAAVPNTACSLADILVDDDPPDLSAAQLAVQQAQSAIAAAGVSASAALDQANAALGYRNEANAAKSSAQTAQGAAEGARDAAASSASSASGSKVSAQAAATSAQQTLSLMFTAGAEGGNARAVYTLNQQIDGGTAAAVYSTAQTINCGGA